MPGRKRQRPPDGDDTGKQSLYEAQRRHEWAKAKREDFKNQVVEGLYVKRDAVAKAVFASNRRVRDGVLNVPARISGLLAAMSDQAQIHAMLTTELQQCLEGLAAE